MSEIPSPIFRPNAFTQRPSPDTSPFSSPHMHTDERPASGLDEIALICEPFFNLKDNLLSSDSCTLNHTGKN